MIDVTRHGSKAIKKETSVKRKTEMCYFVLRNKTETKTKHGFENVFVPNFVTSMFQLFKRES